MPRPRGKKTGSSRRVVGGFVIPEQFNDLCDDLDRLHATFRLVPKFWAEYDKGDSLNWEHIKFDRPTIRASRKNLVGRTGVYTLVIRSEVAGHPHANYLIYVGKTTSQDFYERWMEELRLPKRYPPKQKYLRTMLRKWGNHMWACFAEMDESIGEMEDALKAAWCPPANQDLPGILNQAAPAFPV